MLKYGKFVEYTIILEMCIYIHQKLFSMYSLLNISFTFFIPMELHTFKNKSMQIHQNPDSYHNNVKNKLIFSV